MTIYEIMNRDTGRNDWSGPLTADEAYAYIRAAGTAALSIRCGGQEIDDWEPIYFVAVKGQKGQRVIGIGATVEQALRSALDAERAAIPRAVYRLDPDPHRQRNYGWGDPVLLGWADPAQGSSVRITEPVA